MKSQIDGKWVLIVNEKYTFAGALEECYDQCSKKWNADSTKKGYASNYNNKILPNLPNHDTTSIDSYTKEDYEAVIDLLKKQGYNKPGEKFKPYADGTIQGFRRLINVVVEAASNANLCENVLWGSCFALPENDSSKDACERQVKQKKSFTVTQEIAVFGFLLADPMQRGQEMGLLLMYALGLRNSEACGVNYGDIKRMQCNQNAIVLWVYKTTVRASNALQSSGKTRNADRIIPVPEKLYNLINTRRTNLERIMAEESKTDVNIDDLPIACVNNSYFERCSSDKITAAGREMFKSIKFDAKVLASIDGEMENGDIYYDPLEKDPTAYILRRNFGTHMHILGLSEAEIEYVLGHDIEDAYETRNEFVNEERLIEIKKKMDRRPLLNTLDEKDEIEDVSPTSGKVCYINGDIAKKLRILLKKGRIRLHIKANEPNSALRILLRLSNKTTVIKETIESFCAENKYDRTVNVLDSYHKAYGVK